MDTTLKSKGSETSNTGNAEVKKLRVVNTPIKPELKRVIRRMGKPAKIELVNQLMSDIEGENSSSKLKIQSIKEYWDDYKAGKLTAVVWYQRIYLFFDQPYDEKNPNSGIGSEWQRKIMASMINGTKLPLFWINEKDVNTLHIIDGGHRTRTINAWFTNCIRLPENTIVRIDMYNDGHLVPVNLGNMNWFDIQETYPQFALEWSTTYMIRSEVMDNYEDHEAAGLFFNLNNGNSISAAEDRNSIVSELSAYIREKADYSSTKAMKIFKRANLDYNEKTGKWSSKYHKIPLAKRGFDSFVSKVCYLILKSYVSNVSDANIKTWYEGNHAAEYISGIPFKPDFTKTVKSRFEKTLKWVDDLLIKETSNKGKLAPNEIILLIHIKNYFDMNFTFKVHDGNKLLGSFRKVVKLLKEDAKKDTPVYMFRNKNDQITNIQKIISSMSTCSSTELESWIPMIGDVMVKITHEKYEKAVKSGDKTDQKKFDGGYKLLDKNRSFSKSQKESAEVEQEWECYYHYYCGNMVGEGNDSVGDHSDVVHTKYGDTSDGNLGLTCSDCNSEKNSLSHEEFETIITMRMRDA